MDVTKQQEIDQLMMSMDETENKGKLGANAILGISLAVAKAGAAAKKIPLYQYFAQLAGTPKVILPVPALNVINGGSHAGNKLAMQEFMILPTGAQTFTEAMKMGSEVYHHLKAVIKKRFGLSATAVGDEGGFAPNILDNKDALELIMEAIRQAGYEGKIEIGMDVAASEFFKDGKYDLDFKNPKSDSSKWISSDQLADVYRDFVKSYPIVSIEDPFDQDDWNAWCAFTGSLQIQIIGYALEIFLFSTSLTLHKIFYSDDLTVTNPKRIQTAVDKKACNCLLLKVNQIGTVTEAIQA